MTRPAKAKLRGLHDAGLFPTSLTLRKDSNLWPLQEEKPASESQINKSPACNDQSTTPPSQKPRLAVQGCLDFHQHRHNRLFAQHKQLVQVGLLRRAEVLPAKVWGMYSYLTVSWMIPYRTATPIPRVIIVIPHKISTHPKYMDPNQNLVLSATKGSYMYIFIYNCIYSILLIKLQLGWLRCWKNDWSSG